MCMFSFAACSAGYNIASYSKYERINTQLNEQQNSSTKNLDKQLSYMTEENFKKHCSFFLWKKNEEKRSRQS